MIQFEVLMATFLFFLFSYLLFLELVPLFALSDGSVYPQGKIFDES
jgi:hypothetical protein